VKRGWHRAALIGGGLLAAPVLVLGAWLAQRGDPPPATAAALGSLERCEHYSGLPPGWLREPRAGMVRVATAEAELGSDRGYADEQPVLREKVGGFWIDATEVSNAQFTAFVAATGYVTDAERLGNAAVFASPATDAAASPSTWWKLQAGADWRHPEGPGSSIEGRANHPVVQVTRADALAYARWLGRDLPAEAEWEAAAKAGLANPEADRIIGSAEAPKANFWQGNFPYTDDARDHYAGRAPVGCYAANAYGLHDAIGNVWEWTRDPYTGPRQPHGHGDAALSRPVGTTEVAVIKGGSYLCAANFCVRYRASARHPQEADLPTSHVGFRTVLRSG
jgi:sulfatase modifying factor 1